MANMTTAKQESLVAIVGAGVIGASWAAYFLARGFAVSATDPADGAEARLRTLIDDFWPASPAGRF
jgi:carnitine 3-dehydrogenase